MTGDDAIALPGFAEPVLDAQRAFRALLAAMAGPGSLHAAGAGLTPPAPLQPATAAALLTLIDAETSLYVAPAFAAALPWIAFHCGARIVDNAADAAFILADALPDLATLNAGSDEGPEDAATVILQCASLHDGPAVMLSGPGLAEPRLFRAALPRDFVARWQRNHALFPRGVDLILCAGEEIAALPRSVLATEG